MYTVLNSTIVCAKVRAELTSVVAGKIIQRAEFAAANEGSRRRHKVLSAPPSQPHLGPASRKHVGGAAPGSNPSTNKPNSTYLNCSD